MQTYLLCGSLALNELLSEHFGVFVVGGSPILILFLVGSEEEKVTHFFLWNFYIVLINKYTISRLAKENIKGVSELFLI